MKVIYIYQYFGTPAGSWSTRVYEFTRRWVEEGHEVTVITSPYDKSDIESNSFISKMEIEGVRLIVIKSGDSNKFNQVKRAWRAIIFALVSSYFAIKLKADLVIASSGPITVGLPGLLGKWVGGKKLVFEVRDLWPAGAIEMNLINQHLGYIGLKFEKLIYSNSDQIVTCSAGMTDNLKQRFPGLINKLITIPNVADEFLFAKTKELNALPDWTQDDGVKIFLYAGSLGIMDAIHEAIEGFLHDEIPKEHHLVIIGDGVERNRLEQLVFSKSKQNQIHFLGLITKLEVYQWYKVSSYSLILFANYEILGTSSPNKLFDSIAAGIPVIQNTRGWISSLITENSAGYNIITRTPKEYYNIFKCLDIQKYLKHKVGILNCQNDFRINNISDKYLNSLIEVF